MGTMSRRRIRFYGTLAACFLGFGALGGLAGWVLSCHRKMAPEALALVILLGLLVWVGWQ
jgi:hypothetical protein